MKKCYTKLRTGISYIQQKERSLTGLVLRRNCLLNHITDGNIEERSEIKTRKKM